MGRFSEGKFTARLQTIVSYRRQESGLYREIAGRLPLDGPIRVLDIGTGTGLQLRAIHNRSPGSKLFGLDLSEPTLPLRMISLTWSPATPVCPTGRTPGNVSMRFSGSWCLVGKRCFLNPTGRLISMPPWSRSGEI